MRVAVIGASGYTGLELLRVLVGHPEVELSVLTSERFAGQSIDTFFPSLRGFVNLQLSELSIPTVAREADFVFTALPHGTAMGVVEELIQRGKRVIDLSADFRLKDGDVYKRWYGQHACPSLLQEAVYGLPECYREEIRDARLVANPGCYPTGAILALLPLMESGDLSVTSVVIDAKSGVSGAGRNPSLTTLFCEVSEGFRAYSVAKHRHTPEIEQELSFRAGRSVHVLFVPHLVPMNRGILSTVYVAGPADLSTEQAHAMFQRRYQNEHFVRLCSPGVFPTTQQVRGSNYCDVGVMVTEPTNYIIVISAIDNLVKGASGQAIQNMNVMCGFPETMGLEHVPLAP